ncbi:MSCRAMM family protein [Agromyces humatus]|uniref:SpaA-like prealbumin fold domain-containing protein n=1 Tax=Agromyces humatus TaxID=279573 RepID=A0ABP4WYE9_9MICO|nr:SpaA isopeptide-forming pilin-related protein [Agromyces humatus]
MLHADNPTPETATQPRRRWKHLAAVGGVGALTLSALVAGPALANHPEVSLAGSNFEIDTDANLKVDDPSPSVDWAGVSEQRKADLATGSGDDSFGQGAKEDTAVPTVVDGSIPPNKSDLLNFGTYLEETASGDFLHMFWHRVQEPSGTTNMDFEFNKSEDVSANGVTPVRTAGDLLVQYDLSQGGTNPQLFLSRWVATGPKSLCEAANATPCWGVRDNLSAAGDATGSINTSAIPAAESDGLGDVSVRTFGEATVDFSAIVGDDCVAFGSAYLKSRSSDSFTAALKDFIAPLDTGINNCGALAIEKTKKHAADGPGDHPHAGVVFTITGGDLPANTTVTTDANGEACLAGIAAGDYTVTETVPAGYAVTSANPQTGTVVEGSTCDDATPVVFSNDPLTNLTVSVDSQIPGGTFSSIECDATTESPDTLKDVDLSDMLDDPSVTINDLEPGTYTCVVVIDP